MQAQQKHKGADSGCWSPSCQKASPHFMQPMLFPCPSPATGILLNPERMDGTATKVLSSPCWARLYCIRTSQKDMKWYALPSDWAKYCCYSQANVTKSTPLVLLFLTHPFKIPRERSGKHQREILKRKSKQYPNKASRSKGKVERLSSFISEQTTIKCSNGHANKMGRNWPE